MVLQAEDGYIYLENLQIRHFYPSENKATTRIMEQKDVSVETFKIAGFKLCTNVHVGIPRVSYQLKWLWK